MRDMNNNFRGRKRKKPKREETDGKEEDCKRSDEEDKCLICVYAFYVCI